MHFPRKRGSFGTHLCEFGVKGVIIDVECFILKRGFIWDDKSVFYHKKEVHFGLKSQCFILTKGFSAEKSVFCHNEGGHFQTGEQGWVPFRPVSEGAGHLIYYFVMRVLKLCLQDYSNGFALVHCLSLVHIAQTDTILNVIRIWPCGAN